MSHFTNKIRLLIAVWAVMFPCLANSAQTWKKTASLHYFPDSSQPDGWLLLSKDTLVYDNSGNMLTVKTGWVYVKSLQKEYQESLDSCRYSDNKLVDSIHLNYDTSGVAHSGSRMVISYHLNAITETRYSWTQVKMEWSPKEKDSTVYSIPVAGIQRDKTVNVNIKGMYRFEFDTTVASWVRAGLYNKVDSASGPAMLHLSGSRIASPYDTLLDAVKIVSFSGTDWTTAQITEIDERVIYPGMDRFEPYTRTIFSPDSTAIKSYLWNPSGDNLRYTSKQSYFKDSLGNDTMDTYTLYPPNTPSFDFRYSRTYDADGNNIETITSYFDNQTRHIVSKDVNVFTLIETPVIHQSSRPAGRTVSVDLTAAGILCRAPGISAVRIYSVSGKTVLSLRQQAAPTMTINRSELHRLMSAGTYFAEILYRHGKASFTLPVLR